MSRLFICGITCSSEIDKIKDLVEKTKNYVDGFIWTVDNNPIINFNYSDGHTNTVEENNCLELIKFLEDNKKEGKIIQHPWQNAHDWQANEWLHCGVLKENDWVWMFDSSESPTEYWLKWIRDTIQVYESQQIVAAYCSGRPYLFKYSEYLFFHGTPHWGIYGLNGKTVTTPEEDKSKFIINKRDLNPAKHYQEHDTKYYLYGRSNIIDAFYGKYGQKIVEYHEFCRRQFREHLRKCTKMEPSLEALDLLLTREYPLNEYEIGIIDQEFCLSEYYQRVILGMDFMTTMHPRERWSFKNFLKTGDGWSDKNYLGTRLKYDFQLKSGIEKSYMTKDGDWI